MSKSTRLIDIWMYINKKIDYTAKELADEFHISIRTVQRYMVDLYEMGVPIESNVGIHGGYHLQHNKLLPPISFSLDEMASIIFTYDILEKYTSNPYDIEVQKVKQKLFAQLPVTLRDQFQEMSDHLEMDTPLRNVSTPYLKHILEASIHKNIILFQYDSLLEMKEKEAVPLGISSRNGYWYFPAFDLKHSRINLFRADRVKSFQVKGVYEQKLTALKEWKEEVFQELDQVLIHYKITKKGARMHGSEWVDYEPYTWSHGYEDIRFTIAHRDIPYFGSQLIPLGEEVIILEPEELISFVIEQAKRTIQRYKK